MAIKLVEYVAPVAVNPYAEDVAELAAAQEKNPKITWDLVVPIADFGKTKYKISNAARDIDRTASYLVEEETADGKSAHFIIRLKDKVKSGPRGPRKGGTVAKADQV